RAVIRLALAPPVTAEEEVRDVLHAAATADVLKVDGRHARAIGREAEVRELGVAVDERRMLTGAQPRVDAPGRVDERRVVEHGELVRPGREMPVGAGLPEAGRPLSQERRVEVGEPREAAIELA